MEKKTPGERLRRRRKLLNHLTTDFRIHLLGPPEILLGGRIPKGRLLDRPLAVFVYLAVSGGMIGRSQLTKIFWPDQGEREASTALSRALYALETRGFGPLLEKSSGSLRFLPPRGLHSSFDIHLFTNEAPPGYCRYLHEPAQCPACAHHLRGRLALYRGPFLEGVEIPPDSAPFEGWIAERRLFYEGIAGRLREILSEAPQIEGFDAEERSPPPSRSRRKPLSSGEPREIVVLALVYSLDGSHSPEESLARIRSLRKTAEEIVLRHGGWVPPRSLAGFLGYFGFPAALEFAPRQAALAAREILESPPILAMISGKEGSPPLVLRMGILEGQTTADVRDGNPDLTGQISTAAIALAGTAPQGTIAVPPALFAALTPSFQMEEILTRPSPDGRGPIEIHVLGPKRAIPLSFRDADAGSLSPSSPFVGRKKEARLLEAAWRQIRMGGKMTVWITGEPGIGKSRFLSEFVSGVLAEKGETVVRELRCLPEDRESPWAPVLRLFRSLLEIGPDLSRADVILRTERYLKALGRTTREELSLFLHFLEGEGPWSKSLSRDSPGRIRQKIESLVSELVVKRSQQGPLILAIEDLQWVDFATTSLLMKSALTSPAPRLMLLFTARDLGHLSGRFPEPDLHIPLSSLSPRMTRELLSRVSSTPLPLVEQRTLVRRSGGNPFFLLELVREGAEASQDTRSALSSSAPLESFLSARVESLGEAARTLATAACLGMQFSRRVLSRIVGAAALRRHEPVLLKRGILRPSSGEPERLEFRHALIREHLMESLPPQTAATLHKKIARTLEAYLPDTPEGSPENIARHLAQAGENRAAAAFYRKASERALAIGAMQEAWSALSSALSLLPPGDSDRLPILVAMGPLAAVLYGYAHDSYRKIYREAQSLVSDGEITRATFPVWNGLRASIVGGEGPEAAREIALRIRTFADTQGTEEERLRARYAMGNLAYFAGRLEEAESHLRAALSLLPQIGDRAFGAPLGAYAEDAGVTALAYMGTVRLLRGYPGEARLWHGQASERALRIGQTNSLCHAKVMEIFGWVYSREKQAVRQAAEELGKLAGERGFFQWGALAEIFACWAREKQEDPSLCREVREKIARILPGILPVFFAVEAEAALFAGRPDAVREIVSQALPLESQTGASLVRADLFRLRGESSLQEDRKDPQAREDLRSAVEISRQDKNALFRLRAATALVRVSPSEVRLLEEAVAGIAEGESLPGLLEARALLLALR